MHFKNYKFLRIKPLSSSDDIVIKQLLGFDTAVISGADQPIQKLWNHGDLFHGNFIMSMALWGTVIGALFGDALDIRCIDHLVHALFNWEI